MRITLIEPKAPGKHVFSTVTMPRLGLPLLGTILRDKGYEVNLIYAAGGEIKMSDLMWPDVIGISTTSSTAFEGYHIAKFAYSMGKTIIMGGSHATFSPEEALNNCHYVVRGEADLSFLPLLECIEKGQIPYSVPGISFRVNHEILHNPLPDWVDVTGSPIPDLSIMPNFERMSTIPVMTSRGCPFDCSFCSVTAMFGRKFRCREQEQVLQELANYKNRQVFFVDDNFTANPIRAKELLREMIKKRVTPKWWCAQVRTDAAKDEELLDLMERAGCGTVFIGMESINPVTLEKYNKKQGVGDIEYSIRKFHEHGIMVHGMFVLGADDDTIETIRDTADFAIANRIDTAQFMVLTPFPGTRVFNELEDEGRILTRDWSLFDGHHVVFKPRLMTPLELQVETIKAFKTFYSFRRITQNTFLSGLRSAGYRAVGHWLSNKLEGESRWYIDFLANLSSSDLFSSPGYQYSKTIEKLKLRGLKYISIEKMVHMNIFEQNGAYIIELRGYLNRFALGELFNTILNSLPTTTRKIVVNIEQVSFASEDTIKRLLGWLNAMADQARNIEVSVTLNKGLKAGIHDMMQKHNYSIPRFELLV